MAVMGRCSLGVFLAAPNMVLWSTTILLIGSLHANVVKAWSAPAIDDWLSRSTFFSKVGQGLLLTTTTTTTRMSTASPSLSLSDPSDSGFGAGALLTDECTVTLPLRFLPKGGCWALRATIWNKSMTSSFSYYAILDTGSPFVMIPSMVLAKRSEGLAVAWPPPARARSRSIVSWLTSSSSPSLLSPLLSAAAATATTSGSSQSTEQYGSVQGTMDWYQTPSYSLAGLGLDPLRDVVVGVASDDMASQAGGVFLGLMPNHDSRPTFLQQLSANSHHNFTSFRIHFGTAKAVSLASTQRENCRLVISTQSMLPSSRRDTNEQNALLLPLYDLSRFGLDLYHYAARCVGVIELAFPALFLNGSKSNDMDLTASSSSIDASNNRTNTIRIDVSKLSRPVAVVLDTGLTGCIFSDSLTNEILQQKPQMLDTKLAKTEAFDAFVASMQGVKLQLETLDEVPLELASGAQYWDFSSFYLPWFNGDRSKYDDHFPHIIAVGNTFWVGTESLTVDSKAGLAMIEQTLEA